MHGRPTDQRYHHKDRESRTWNPQLTVNGQTRALGEVGGHVTLLDWLRVGGSPAARRAAPRASAAPAPCWSPDPTATAGTRWTAINACLVPAAGLDDQEVVTAEGLGAPDRLHPVQREMAVRGGSQCGYCTPGFICSMAAEFYRADRRRRHERHGAHAGRGGGAGASPERPRGGRGTDDRRRARPERPRAQAPDHEHGPNGFDLHALSGNLCRCTGYRPIRDAAYALGAPDARRPAVRPAQSQPAPAPRRHPDRPAPTATSSGPTDLAEALRLLAEHPDARLVAGSTDWGVELNIRHARARLTIGIDRLPELRRLEIGDDFIDIGAALTLTEIERGLAGRIPLLAEMFPQFASRLIRNGATLGGNLGTGSPIGDSPARAARAGRSLVLASRGGEREVPLADYFTGYRQSVKRPDELIKSIRIPLPVAPISAFHKIAKRRFDDISSVAVAFALRLEAGRAGAGGRATSRSGSAAWPPRRCAPGPPRPP